MFRSITVSDNLQLSAKCRIPYLSIIGIGIIEFLVLSTYLCYGVYYSTFVRIGVCDFHTGFWTPVVFIASWSITEPWSRSLAEYYEENREDVHRYVISVSVLLHCMGLLLSYAPSPNIYFQIAFYGLFGGICTSFVTTQLKATAIGFFEDNPKVFEIIRQVSRATSLFVMPHVIISLADSYDIFAAQFIMAAIILNGIPACLLLKGKPQGTPTVISRYQTFPGLSIPLQDIHIKETSIEEDSSTDEEDYTIPENSSETSFSNNEVPETIETLGDTIRAYFRNIGVNILPQIPEENEDDIKSIDVINSKRVSRISMKLEEINETNKRDGIRAMLNSNEKLFIPQLNQSHSQSSISSSILNSGDAETNSLNVSSFLKDMKSVHRTTFLCCTPYRKYVLKRKIRNMKSCVLDYFVKPLWSSLKEIQFYIALFSKATLCLTSTMIITIIPFVQIDITINVKNTLTSEVANWFLSIIAFSWWFFLLGSPVIIKWSNLQTRLAFVVGLCICAASIFVMANNLATDLITLMCLLYGFGYGVVSYSEETVYRSFLGVRKWRQMQGTLETFSGIFVITMYYFIYTYKLDSHIIFVSALLVYSVNAIMWIVTPVMKFLIITVFKNCQRNKDILY